MERSLAPSLLICAALVAAPPAARAGAASPPPVLLAAAAEGEESAADEAKLKKEAEKEAEKKAKEAAKRAEEARKRAEKEAKKARKKGEEKGEEVEEPAAAAAESKTAPAQPLQKSFTITPKSAQQPAAGPVPSKMAPGVVAPMQVAPGTFAPKALSPPVSRGGAPVYTAPGGPTTTFTRGELDKPAVPGFGLAPPGGGLSPTSGPSSGISRPGAAGEGQKIATPPEGAKLPPGKLHLLVNGEFGEISVPFGQPVNASWDLSTAPSTEGIGIYISTDLGKTCADIADDNDILPSSGYHAGFPSGSASLDLSGQPAGTTFAFIGCAADPDDSGKVKYRKADTNVVKVRLEAMPDLIVSALEMVSDEIRFKVKNIGEYEKPPGEVDYVVGLTYASADGRTFTRGFGGTAGITSLSRLAPGEETGEDRVTEQRDMKFDGVKEFQLCINPGNKIPESDRGNNCVKRSSGEVLPDLKIVKGHMTLTKPPKDKGFWDYAKDIGRCAGPQIVVSLAYGHCNMEFDPGGDSDAVFVTLRNEGGAAINRGDVRIDLQYDGKAIEGGGIASFNRPLGPGQEIQVSKGIGPATHWKYDDEACCTAVATVDPNGKILESDERNNKFTITDVER